MSDFTPRANLRLPGGGSTGTILPDEQVDIDVLNDNFRKIDALLGARNIPSASSYSGSMDGDLVYARDTKLLSIYDASSAGLVNPRVAGGTRFKGTQAQMAAFTGAEDGDSFFNTTDNSDYVRIGSTWRGGFGVISAGSSGVTLAASLLKNNGDGTAKLVVRANHATNMQGLMVGVVPPAFLPSVVWAGIASSALASAGNQSCSLRLDNVTGAITVIGLTAASTSVWAAFDYPLATP